MIEGNFKQSAKGTLELNLSSQNDLLRIKGTATYGRKLLLNFSDNYVPKSVTTIITDGMPKKNGVFSSIETTGLPSKYKVNIIYNAYSVQLHVTKNK